MTIISRCQRYDFRRIQLDKIKETLKMIADEENIKIDDKTLTIIAKKADGALRDAESYFDQAVAFSKGKIDSELVSQMLNLIDEELYFNISDGVLNKDFKVVFHTSEKLYENGWDFNDFLDGLIEHFRNILSAVVTNSTNSIETADVYKARYLEYEDNFSEADTLRILNFLNKSQQELRFSQNHKLKIEIILSQLIAFENTKTISELISLINSKDYETNKQEESKKVFYSSPDSSKKKVDSFSKSFKEEIKVNKPSVTLTGPSSHPNLGFDDIVNKWEYFIQSVNAEKGFTLGPALSGFNLISFHENNLYFSSEKQEDLNTFRLHEKYLAKKSEEFFGRRFNFIASINSKLHLTPESKDKSAEDRQTEFSDPYEEIIINKLSGEKIA